MPDAFVLDMREIGGIPVAAEAAVADPCDSVRSSARGRGGPFAMTAFDVDDGFRHLPKETRMQCGVCWAIYDPALGDEARQIPPGTAFADLPDDWCCPACDASREKFQALGTGDGGGSG
jgi:rubredoxin